MKEREGESQAEGRGAGAARAITEIFAEAARAAIPGGDEEEPEAAGTAPPEVDTAGPREAADEKGETR